MTRRCVVHRVTEERYLGFMDLGIYLKAAEGSTEALSVVYVFE